MEHGVNVILQQIVCSSPPNNSILSMKNNLNNRQNTCGFIHYYIALMIVYQISSFLIDVPL